MDKYEYNWNMINHLSVSRDACLFLQANQSSCQKVFHMHALEEVIPLAGFVLNNTVDKAAPVHERAVPAMGNGTYSLRACYYEPETQVKGI